MPTHSIKSRALRHEVTYLVIHDKADYPLQPRWDWTGNDFGGTWTYGAQRRRGVGIDTTLGAISISCGESTIGRTLSAIDTTVMSAVRTLTLQDHPAAPTPAHSTAICQASVDAVTNMIHAARAIAQDIMSAYDEQPIELSPQLFTAYASAYAEELSRASELAHAEQLEQLRSETDDFARMSKDLGWASSAMYWWTLTSINERGQTLLAPLLPDFTAPDPRTIKRLTDGADADYQAVVDGYLSRIATTENARAVSGGPEGGWLGKKIADSTLYALPGALRGGNALVSLAGVGDTLITWGGSAWTVGTAGVLAATIGGAAAGGVTGGPVGALGGASTAAAIAGFFGTAAAAAGVVLVIEGAILKYVIPMTPAILMVLAIVGWMVLVIEMLVAAPLLAVAHAFAGGSDFAAPETRHGYAVAIGATMRPLLLTFGFIFAWLLIDVSMAFLGMALEVYLYSLVGTTTGPVMILSTIGVVLAAITALVYYVMRLVTHLAQHVPMWIGGTQGSDLGTDAAATRAVEQGESGSVGVRRVVGGAAGALSAQKIAGAGGGGKSPGGGGGGGAAGGAGAGGGDTLETPTITPAPASASSGSGGAADSRDAWGGGWSDAYSASAPAPAPRASAKMQARATKPRSKYGPVAEG
ncbi:MAG: DotA/TraY family protein [Gammaproteobacteria bacterium]|nr:DotA/TraY family protein [Gammaproteobacteria bacterium]